MQTIHINAPLLRSLLTLTTVIEAKDAYTGGHTWRVSNYARLLAESMNLSKDEIFITFLGGLVHDLGKVGISDAILNKPSSLSETEFAVMRRHPGIGQDIMRDHPLASIINDVVFQHHERFDGNGYPNRLEGDRISLSARIVAIADTFDAMTSARPYRPAMSIEKAFGILKAESGKQLDEKPLTGFFELGKHGKLEHIIGHSSLGSSLVSCPQCGPIIAVPRGKSDGDHIACPACAGRFRLHAHGDGFEVEWEKLLDPALIAPDFSVIDEALQSVPDSVRL